MSDISDLDYQLVAHAIAGIDQTLDEAECSLDVMAGRICRWIEEALAGQDKSLARIRTKVTRSINRLHSGMADGIDHIWVQVRSWIDSQLAQHEWELTQLGVRARLLEIGQGTDDIVPSLTAGKPPVPEYCGRLCLWIDQDTPGFAALLHVLREIRDRMSPTIIPERAAVSEETTVDAITSTDTVHGPVIHTDEVANKWLA